MDWKGYISLVSVAAAVYCAIGVGIWFRKMNWLTEAADGSLLRLTNNVLLPALILNSILKNGALKLPGNMLLAPLAGFFTVAIGMALAMACGKYLGQLLGIKTQNALWAFVLCIGVYSFSYVPLALAGLLLSPDTGVLLAFNLGIEISLWTVGLILLGVTGVMKGWKRILNPPLATIIVALILNIAGLDAYLPRFFFWATGLLGQCAVPLGLILIGATLMDNWHNLEIRGGGKIMLASCVLRLAIVPFLFLLMARFIPFSRELKEVLVLQAAMPAAIVPTIIMIRHYGGESTTAMRVVVSTSIASLATIPLWIWLGRIFARLY
jgi:predicted permease